MQRLTTGSTVSSASSVLAPLGLVAVAVASITMVASLAWGLTQGDLLAEGPALVRMPWGLVSLVEIYVGITLFGCWVFWRERSPLRAGAWLLAVVLVGNIVSCAYVIIALAVSNGDPLRFWMGTRAPRVENMNGYER